jgi:hypothetical protein
MGEYQEGAEKGIYPRASHLLKKEEPIRIADR